DGLPDSTAGKPEISLNARIRLLPNASLQTKLFFLNMTATSNGTEDYNGDGIINDGGSGVDANGRLHGPVLSESNDHVDYNGDGDMSDTLSESDANSDLRFSKGTGLTGQIFIDINDPDPFNTDVPNRLTFSELT